MTNIPHTLIILCSACTDKLSAAATVHFLWETHMNACYYTSCLLLCVNTSCGMLTPLSVNTPCTKDEDQSIRMNEQRTGYGAEQEWRSE